MKRDSMEDRFVDAANMYDDILIYFGIYVFADR